MSKIADMQHFVLSHF